MARLSTVVMLLSIVSLSVSLSCGALVLAVLWSTCMRAQLQSPLKQPPIKATDPVFFTWPHWGAFHDAAFQSQGGRSLEHVLNYLREDGPEKDGRWAKSGGRKALEGFGEGFGEGRVKERLRDWLVGSPEAKWALENALGAAQKDLLLQTRLQGILGRKFSKVVGKEVLQEPSPENPASKRDGKKPLEWKKQVFPPSSSSHADPLPSAGSERAAESTNGGAENPQNPTTPAPHSKPSIFEETKLHHTPEFSSAAESPSKTLKPPAAPTEGQPRLIDIKPSTGYLEPVFNSTSHSYALHVRVHTKTITLTPVLAPGLENITIYMGGKPVENNTQSEPITLPKNTRQSFLVPIILKRTGHDEPEAIYLVKVFRDIEPEGGFFWRLRVLAAVGLAVTLITMISFLTYSAYMWDKLRREQLRAGAYETVGPDDDDGWRSE